MLTPSNFNDIGYNIYLCNFDKVEAMPSNKDSKNVSIC